MLTISYIREHRQHVIDSLSKRGFRDTLIIDDILHMDDKLKKTKHQLNNANAQLNEITEQIGHSKGKEFELTKFKEEIKNLKSVISAEKTELSRLDSLINDTLHKIPNILYDGVPKGSGITDNLVVCQSDCLPEKKDWMLPHWDLVKKYNLVDFELGNKITGSGFPVYIDKAAKLLRSLISFLIDEATAEGYKEIWPPLVVNEKSLHATGQMPDYEGQMYKVENENLYLISTAEVPITNLYRDVTLSYKDLPIKNVAYTPCFRREAGSWGKHVRGLNRLHQFDKVELVQIVHPDESYKAIEPMRLFVQNTIEKLEIPYRTLLLCSGEMSTKAALQYDLEAWSAGQESWLEVSSISNFESYQTNRMNLKFKSTDEKRHLLHTLNGSLFGLPRTIASILENNQTKNGIKVPKVLHKYTGFEIIV